MEPTQDPPQEPQASPANRRPSILSVLPPLGPEAEAVLASLYRSQPATRQQVAQRTGLPRNQVESGLRRLHALGVLRVSDFLHDGKPRVVWLDFVPFAARLAAAPAPPGLGPHALPSPTPLAEVAA